MSIQQGVALALVVLVLLLEGVARLRRLPADRRRQATVLPPALPPPLPQPAPAPAVSLAPRPLSRVPLSEGPGASAHRRRVLGPRHDEGAAQWLRPVRNLRRAMVIAAILNHPPQ